MKNRWLTGFNKSKGDVDAMLAYLNQQGVEVVNYNQQDKIVEVLYHDKKLFIILSYLEVTTNEEQTEAIVNIIKPNTWIKYEDQCVFLGMHKYMDQWIFFGFNNQILKLEGPDGHLHAQFIFRNADHLGLALKYCDAGQIEVPYIINNVTNQNIPVDLIKTTFIEYQVSGSLPGSLDFLLDTNKFYN